MSGLVARTALTARARSSAVSPARRANWPNRSVEPSGSGPTSTVIRSSWTSPPSLSRCAARDPPPISTV